MCSKRLEDRAHSTLGDFEAFRDGRRSAGCESGNVSRSTIGGGPKKKEKGEKEIERETKLVFAVAI